MKKKKKRIEEHQNVMSKQINMLYWLYQQRCFLEKELCLDMNGSSSSIEM